MPKVLGQASRLFAIAFWVVLLWLLRVPGVSAQSGVLTVFPPCNNESNTVQMHVSGTGIVSFVFAAEPGKVVAINNIAATTGVVPSHQVPQGLVSVVDISGGTLFFNADLPSLTQLQLASLQYLNGVFASKSDTKLEIDWGFIPSGISLDLKAVGCWVTPT